MYGRKKYIPIMAIVGFLGAGKTTLLNHILTKNQGLKIGVIVNDFGDINIDAMLVARQTDQELELSNGCICCTLEGNTLDDAIGQLAHAGSTIDYIVIEASGLAEPRELLRLLVHSKNPYARFDSLVSVVDSGNILDTKEKHPSFIEQLSLADIIILNKLDLIGKKKMGDVEGYVRFVNTDARLLYADHGRVDTRLLLAPDSLARQDEPAARQLALTADHNEAHDDHLHHQYAHVSLSTDRPIDPHLWEKFIHDLPPAIYRAKGFLYFGMKGLEQKYVFQLVGRRHEMKIDEWLSDTPRTNVVFIGTDFDTKAFEQSLQNLIDAKPDDVSDDTIMDVLKYR